MLRRVSNTLLIFLFAFGVFFEQSAVAVSDDTLWLILPSIMGGKGKTGVLQANMTGMTQLYTLDAAVVPADRKTEDSGVFHYQLLEKKGSTAASDGAGIRAAGAGAGNLIGVPAAGTPGLALTSTVGSVMTLFAVTDPAAKYVYIALDYTNADTLAIIKQLGTGLIRVELSTNKVENVAPGCVVAPIPNTYYKVMQSGDKPIQFDSDGNIVFNGYRLVNGTIYKMPGLKRVSISNMTVSALTDDSQYVLFFKTMGDGSVAMQYQSTLNGAAQLSLWKPASGEIVLADSLVYYFFKDSYKSIIYKESKAPHDTVTFARSNDSGGIDRVKLPNTPYFAVVGDDGNLYSIDANQPGGPGTAANVLVSTILPYATSPLKTTSVDNVSTLPWTEMPVQISKGYMYFVARVDPGDGFGLRDFINVQRLRGTDRITVLGDKRFQLYAWRQTGGYEKLYFTAKDRASSSSTTYAGVIDTVKLRQGLPAEQYLTLQPVASATGAAALVKDMEILAPQIPLADPGYEPVISDVSRTQFAEGITFSKYMNIPSVESGLEFTVRNGSAVPYLPIWLLSSLYLIPDLDGLGNSSAIPLDVNVCYAVNLSGTVKDLWDWPLWDKNNFLPISIGAACDAPTCNYGVDKTTLVFDAAGADQSVAVTATASTCAWVTQIPADAAWLTATAGGTGSGSATITASANTETTSRSATIQVAGKDVMVTQAGYEPICNATVSPLTVYAPTAGGPQTITVTESDSRCSWTASESLDWVSISAGASGTGNGTVTLSVAANTATTSRSGIIQVAQKTVGISQRGTGPGEFHPMGVAVDAAGNVFVTDHPQWNHILPRILKFSSDCEFLTTWGSSGTGDGQFTNPWGIAVASDDTIYVTDENNNNVQQFSQTFTFKNKWGTQGFGDGQLNNPHDVATDKSGNVYIVDTNNHRIQKFTPTGQFLTKWGSLTLSNEDGKFTSALGIAVDKSGYVFVADGAQGSIQKFSPEGTFLAKFGSVGTGDGQFNTPFDVATDSLGYIYVVDHSNSRIQKFSSNGIFLSKWGRYNPGTDGNFMYPYHIAIDSSDNVYVTDDNCLQKFTSNGAFLTKWCYN